MPASNKSWMFIIFNTENWYLVSYEDDENIRVLSGEEIHHIFPADEDDRNFQIGDIVSAIWLPNGQFYDAKVLQKGGEFTF